MFVRTSFCIVTLLSPFLLFHVFLGNECPGDQPVIGVVAAIQGYSSLNLETFGIIATGKLQLYVS